MATPGSIKVGGVYFAIEGDDKHFTKSILNAERRGGRAARSLEKDFNRVDAAAARADARINKMGGSILALAAGAGLAVGASVGILKDFGQAMSTVQAVTGATVEQMAALTAEARRLGATTRFSATEAADGMGYLARAGFTANETLMAIEGTLKLAQAGGLDLARSADIASNVLSGFNLKAAETGRIVDILAKAASSSNTDVNQLGEALKFAAPTAVALGIGVEETVAVIGKLSDAGIQAGLAGRGFQSFATKFVQESGKIKDIIGDYDLAAEGVEGVIKRMVEAGITTEQVVEIFRAENLDVFTVLANAAFDAEKGLGALTGKLKSARGTADEMARVMDDNLNGAIKNTISKLQELILALGDAGATDALIASFNGMSSLLKVAAENADILGIAMIALSARALLPLVTATIPKVTAALAALRAQLFLLASTSGSVIGTINGAAAATLASVNPLTAALVAAGAAYIVLARAQGRAEERIREGNRALKESKEVLDEVRALAKNEDGTFRAIESGAEDATEKIFDLKNAIDQLAEGMQNIREQGELGRALKLGESLFDINQQIAGLESERQKAEYYSQKISERTGLPIDANALSEFDASEEGKLLLFLKQRRAALENEIRKQTDGLTYQDLVDAFLGKGTNEADETGGKGGPKFDAEAARKQLESLSAIERGVALEAARLAGNEELVQILEDMATYEQLVNDYLASNLELTQARARAEDDINRLKAARKEGEANAALGDDVDSLLKDLNDQADANAKAAKDAADKLEQEIQDRKDKFAGYISDALTQAITDGDWGTAVKEVFGRSVSEALTDAINDLASVIVDVISGAFDGKDIGSGISSFIGSVFGGGRAAGGSVSAYDRYLVGENGPEMFIPGADGMIIPNEIINPQIDKGSMGGGGLTVLAPFTVQGSITEEVFPRVQTMFREFAQQVPGMVDARVSDRKKRGAL
jgi:TP901 family phage tail tape measure protein